MANEIPTDRNISKREWMLLALFLVLGGVLRILFVGSVQVEQFDEGVYASNRWFTLEEGARYPDRHLYAPPLWPAVLEYSQLLFGPTSLGVMLPGIVCGTLAITVLWRSLRCWVGRQEALLVAGILSVSGFHIFFSRTALTDVPVTMLMLSGIGLGWSSLSRGSFRAAIGAGLLTGLGWSVKYNGWFPLAVTGAGFAAANLFHVKQCGVLFKHWGSWLLMVTVAALVWFPAWRDLQSPGRGGYAAVAANHAGYVSGWENWREHFRLQFENMAWFDNEVVSYGFVVLIATFILVRFGAAQKQGTKTNDDFSSLFRKTSPELAVVLAVYCLPAVAGMGFSLPRLLFSFALMGLGIRLFFLLREAWGGQPLTSRTLAGWMALAWFGSLVLVTPLYQPYPRLALPLYFALLIGTASGVQELKRLFSTDESESSDASNSIPTPAVSRGTKTGFVTWAAVSLVVGHVLVGPRIDPQHDGSPWQSRLSMERASRQIVDVCNERGEERLSSSVAYILYVYGEPALYYHLCRLAPQNVVIAPVSNLGFLNGPAGREPVPIYLIAGPHTIRNADYLRQREAAGDRLENIADIKVRISDLLLLNAYTAREIAESDDVTSEVTIELLLMRPAASSDTQ